MKRIISIALILALSLSAFILVGCSAEKNESIAYNKYVVNRTVDVDKIELHHMYGTLSSIVDFAATADTDDSSEIEDFLKKLASENLSFEAMEEDPSFSELTVTEHLGVRLCHDKDEYCYIRIATTGYVYVYDTDKNDEEICFKSTTTVDFKAYKDFYKKWYNF